MSLYHLLGINKKIVSVLCNQILVLSLTIPTQDCQYRFLGVRWSEIKEKVIDTWIDLISKILDSLFAKLFSVFLLKKLNLRL